MFGSNDDNKSPAAAGEKKGLFGWLRKKPQETVVEQPQAQPEPVPEPLIEAEPVAEIPAPVVLPMAEPVLQPVVEAVPEPEPVPEHKPWLELPVAEEPVALVEDVQAEHVTPPIPTVDESVEVVVEAQPVVEAPAPAPAPAPARVASASRTPRVPPTPALGPDLRPRARPCRLSALTLGLPAPAWGQPLAGRPSLGRP